jgi:hypothetical protein
MPIKLCKVTSDILVNNKLIINVLLIFIQIFSIFNFKSFQIATIHRLNPKWV